MNLNTVFGTKIGQTQGFLENGKRIPMSCILIGKNTVSQMKTVEKDGYWGAQIAFGNKNKLSKSTQGHLKKAGIDTKPRFFREIRLNEAVEDITVGGDVDIAEVLKPGDIISVTGISKGKGYAGVVKRHNFAGGPRTHGQSDRERHPGSIGQSTTPGRVYKGKKMAGRMGHEQVTVKNLIVIDIDGDTILVKGLVPGGRGSVIKIVKIGETKNFVPLYKGEKDESVEEKIEAAEEVVETKEETKNEEVKEEVEENVAEKTAEPTVQEEEKVEVEKEAVEEKIEAEPKEEDKK